MAEPNVPNQASNTDKSEGQRWRSDPDTIENADREERPEQLHDEGNDRGAGLTNRPNDDLLNRNAGRRYDTPRQYEKKEDDDPVMPADDSTLKTKI